nr:hypothetical protein CFP56_55445 [Quercus suber]
MARSVTFSDVIIWTQVWGLPFDLSNEEAGLDTRRGLGQEVEVDKKTFSSDQARFIRVRVVIPLDKPIQRGGCVSNSKGDQKPKDPDQTATPYGDWLKAGYWRKDDGRNRELNSPIERDTMSKARPKQDLRLRVPPRSNAVTPNNGFGENYRSNDNNDGMVSKAALNQRIKDNGINGADSTELVYDHKDTPCTKTTCTNGIEDMGMEVTYNELYNSINQAANLYSVQVEYVGPTQTP